MIFVGLLIMWLFLGFVIAGVAGLTMSFNRHWFSPKWFIPFGPLAIIVWIILKYGKV